MLVPEQTSLIETRSRASQRIEVSSILFGAVLFAIGIDWCIDAWQDVLNPARHWKVPRPAWVNICCLVTLIPCSIKRAAHGCGGRVVGLSEGCYFKYSSRGERLPLNSDFRRFGDAHGTVLVVSNDLRHGGICSDRDVGVRDRYLSGVGTCLP